MIDSSFEKYPFYKDSLDICRPSDSNFDILLRYDFEYPEIHICKISNGWCPLLEANNYYSSFKELETFYSKHKDDFDIKDEYGRLFSWESFVKELKSFKQKAIKSHLEEYGSPLAYEYIKYTRDSDGFEWTNTHFS